MYVLGGRSSFHTVQNQQMCAEKIARACPWGRGRKSRIRISCGQYGHGQYSYGVCSFGKRERSALVMDFEYSYGASHLSALAYMRNTPVSAA